MYKFLPALIVTIIFSFLISEPSSLSILVTEDIVISGCMDKNACNYNKDAINPDRSCVYPKQNYDCFGNCEVEFDDCGVCGGTVFPVVNGRDYPPFDRGIFCNCDEKSPQCNCPDQCCDNNDCSNEKVCLGPKEGRGKVMLWAQFACVNNLCQMEPTGYSNSSAASCYECEFPNFEDRCGVCGGDNACNENSEDFKKNIIIANYISSNFKNIVFGVILITMSLVIFA